MFAKRSKTASSIVEWGPTLLVCAAVALIIYLLFKGPKSSPNTSIRSPANTLVGDRVAFRADGDSYRKGRTLTELESDQISLRSALQTQRERVERISGALALYRVALTEFQNQGSAQQTDADLDAALREFNTAFGTELVGSDGVKISLLAPDQLKRHLEQARATINKLEIQDLTNAKDSQALRECREGITYELRQFNLDKFYLVVKKLHDSLKNTLGIQLTPDAPSYEVKYNRDQDTLVSEQKITIHLAKTPASQIDLTGFFSSGESRLAKDLYEDVLIKEDLFDERTLQPNNPVYRLRPGVNDLVLAKRVTRRNASEKAIDTSLPLQFRRVTIDWPVPAARAVTLELEERGNANTTWPFVLSIEDKPDASLTRITMPPHSVYFVDPVAEIKTTPVADELIPNVSDSKLRILRPGSQRIIRVELLPGYLSNIVGAKIKDYLSRENALAALIVWLLTSGMVAALYPTRRDTS